MNRKTRSFSLIVGSLLSVAIICMQLCHFQEKSVSVKELSTEQHQNSDDADEELLLPLSSYSLPTTIQVSVNFDVYCLFEILATEPETENAAEEKPTHPEKLFNTLFRVIIAPNAP